MPESRRIGLDNPNLSGRVRAHGRSAHYVRRPVQPHVRRGIDGFAMPATVPPKATTIHTPKPVMLPKSASATEPRNTAAVKPALPRQSRSNVLARPKPVITAKKKKTRKKDHSRISFVMVSMAVMVFIAGAAVSYLGWKTNKQAAAQMGVLSSTTEGEDGDVPTEETVSSDAISSYRVAPDMPRVIRIPRLNVEARIKRLGVKANGMLAAPSNIFDAGWYDGSSKPGENGAVLIDGHVHGPTKPGVFFRLNNLREGDTVEIERGDGQVFSYKVVTSESVDQDKVDMAKALTPIEAGKPGLNIITCSGRYDIRTNKYEQRLVVYLVQQ